MTKLPFRNSYVMGSLLSSCRRLWTFISLRSSCRSRPAKPFGEALHLFLGAHDLLERKLRPAAQLLALGAFPGGQAPVDRLFVTSRHRQAFANTRYRFYPAAGRQSPSFG